METNNRKENNRADIRDKYTALVRSSRYIKDLDMRIQSSRDQVDISTAVKMSLQGDKESLVGSRDILMAIISLGEDRPLYSKIRATCALYDVASNNNLWNPEFFGNLTDTINNKPEDEKRILFGALYASATAWSLENGRDLGTTHDTLKNQSSRDDYSSEFLASIEAARAEIKDLFDRFSFRREFASVVIHSHAQEKSESIPGVGLPDSIIYLGKSRGALRLPSFKKLAEMVIYGVPNVKAGINEARTLGVLIGCETPFKKNKPGIGKIESNSDKKFSYIYLRGIRGVEKQEVATFDALSFYIAAKISKNKNTPQDFEIIDTSDLSESEKEAKRMKIVGRAVNLWTDRITDGIGKDKNGESTSIFSFALDEYRSFNPSWQGTDADALAKLRKSVATTAFEKQKDGSIRLRSQDEIATGFIGRVWKLDFDDDDRFQMGLAHLQNRDSVLWNEIDKLAPRLKTFVSKIVIGRSGFEDYTPEIAKEMMDAILEAANRRYAEFLTLRCETIRDIIHHKI